MNDEKKQRKILPVAEWLASLPAKRIAGKVIYRNLKNEILVVKPNYRNDWLLPGGMIEEGESPIAGTLREVEEELGIKPEYLRFAGIDFRANEQGDLVSAKQDKSLDFILVFFNGGFLSDETISTIKREEDELDELKFVGKEDLKEYVEEADLKRIDRFLESNGEPVLLEEGEFAANVFPAIDSYQYVRLTAATMVVDEVAGKMLLVQEEQPSAYGKWHLPSGHVDAGETIKQAALRETKEETGLTVELDTRLGVMHMSIELPVQHLFLSTAFSGELKPQENEILDVKWFKISEVHELGNDLRFPETIIEAIRLYEQYKQSV